MAPRKTVLLRIQPELYEALQRWAADEFRSVNGHVEYILHGAVRRARREVRPEGEPGGGAARSDGAPGGAVGPERGTDREGPGAEAARDG